MAKTKAELLAEMVAYSGEISSATCRLEDAAVRLIMAEDSVATIKASMAEKQAKVERAQALLETTAMQLAELQKTEGGR